MLHHIFFGGDSYIPNQLQSFGSYTESDMEQGEFPNPSASRHRVAVPSHARTGCAAPLHHDDSMSNVTKDMPALLQLIPPKPEKSNATRSGFHSCRRRSGYSGSLPSGEGDHSQAIDTLLTTGKIVRFLAKPGCASRHLRRASPSKIVNSLVNSDGQKSDFFSPFQSHQKGHSTE